MSVPAKIAATMAVAALAAMTMHACDEAQAATVVTGEGIFMPRGNMAAQFNGQLCKAPNVCTTVSSMPVSVNRQAEKLEVAVNAATGEVIIGGYSMSAASVHKLINKWAANPETAPDAEKLRLIVTTGNPYRKYGGADKDQPSAIPLPANQPYEHLDVSLQYDSVSDVPDRRGWYSMVEVSLSRHLAYGEADLNDPNNLVYTEGNTTYMLIPAKDLRQLSGMRFLRDIGWVSEERYAAEDARRRALIERDYDRPDYVAQGDEADWPTVPGAEAHRVHPERVDEDSEDDGAVAERASVDVESRVEKRADRDDVDTADAGKRTGLNSAGSPTGSAGERGAGDNDSTDEPVGGPESTDGASE